MRGPRSSQHRWYYVLAALLIALRVAVMHANPAGLSGIDAHDEVAHDHEARTSVSVMPAPAQPVAPIDPCHAVSAACCVLAMPSPAPRQLLALMALAIAVVTGLSVVPRLQRASVAARGVSWRPPPDLSALCLLRI